MNDPAPIPAAVDDRRGTGEVPVLQPGDRVTHTVTFHWDAPDGEIMKVDPVLVWSASSGVITIYDPPQTTTYTP